MKIAEAKVLMRASAEGAREFFDKEIKGFSIDSRATAPGELFFALSPEDYRRHCFTATSFADAHRFIPQAFGWMLHANTFAGNDLKSIWHDDHMDHDHAMIGEPH